MSKKQLQAIYRYPKFWAECFGISEFLPRSAAEMEQLAWDSCDIILVTGDAYIDHPSFGMAIIGRLLEAQGFRVGIIDQPNWQDCHDFKRLGKPNLFFGVTSGNMDSMINHYTADRKIRSDDAYTPGGVSGKRPDRAVIQYTKRCREAYKNTPIVIGGIEASLRRIAHYDYWKDQVLPSVLVSSAADLLVFGNGERQICEIAHRLARGQSIERCDDIRGTACILHSQKKHWTEMDMSRIDFPEKKDALIKAFQSPYDTAQCDTKEPNEKEIKINVIDSISRNQTKRDKTVVRLPSYEKVSKDKALYAHASRILHLETNPHNARALIQQHGQQIVWINPPAMPLMESEMDYLFDMPYKRTAHPQHINPIPAYDMIKFSVNIMRGCFGGCTFCSITEHEGRIIQNRSKQSILQEIENIRDKTPDFKGYISDLGGPTANMYRLACKSSEIEASCRRLSCVYPQICSHLNTDHQPLIDLYRDARAIEGIKRVFIASGLRYDLAVQSEQYIEELVTHHIGGYLKIAPEHSESGPLSKMLKPGMDSYYEFKRLFDKYSKKAGKEQYLIPYFIAAHPGTEDKDMVYLALWLKQNGFRPDQVQNFYPSPMALATAMYHSQYNPLKKLKYKQEVVYSAKTESQRKLHKALLRYHDKNNWSLIRSALKQLGMEYLIGNGKEHLVPSQQPRTTAKSHHRRHK